MSKVISFEGVDGSGKTTIIQQVAENLKEKGLSVIVLQEPGTTEAGLKIRQLLKSGVEMSPVTELLLFMASRADMVHRIVEDYQKNYDIILLDRFVDSTVVYQGYGNGHDLFTIQYLNDLVTQGIKVDGTAFIDVDLEVAATRRDDRMVMDDKFDRDMTYAQKVYDGYQEWYLLNVDRMQAFDNGDGVDTEEIVLDIVDWLENL